MAFFPNFTYPQFSNMSLSNPDREEKFLTNQFDQLDFSSSQKNTHSMENLTSKVKALVLNNSITLTLPPSKQKYQQIIDPLLKLVEKGEKMEACKRAIDIQSTTLRVSALHTIVYTLIKDKSLEDEDVKFAIRLTWEFKKRINEYKSEYITIRNLLRKHLPSSNNLLE